MHATRAAVYYLPHLDRPALRKRKLRIFIDDDGLADGDTHHYQLTRAFRSIGAACLLDDEEFGELGELCHYLEAETADFVLLAPKLYSRSLGAWCAVETLSADWMRALADALSVHFPHFRHEPYFEECFSQQIEERHAAEALEVTQIVLRARPELVDVPTGLGYADNRNVEVTPFQHRLQRRENLLVSKIPGGAEKDQRI